TLSNGLKLLDGAVSGMAEGETLAGETAFKLYDTYGFPYDLTEDALRARGLGIDREGFDAAMAEQKAAARAAWKGSGDAASETVWFDIAEQHGGTEFVGYSTDEADGQVVAIVKDGARVECAGQGDEVLLVTNQTPFYAESGGQAGDTGTLCDEAGLSGTVTDTSKPLGRLHAHHLTIDAGEIAIGQVVTLTIDAERRARLRANHSATHLMHAALRNRLGDHVTQKGSLVAEDRLRFDFSHPKALEPDEIAAVDADVNAQIRDNASVVTRLMTPDEAVEAGALALFGEKYGDEVRVLSMGRNGPADYSVELCGGTHVSALGDIGLFVIISESAVSAGVRRIEALTGEAARLWYRDREAKLLRAAETLKTSADELPGRVAALLDERKRLEKELGEARKTLAMGGGGASGAKAETIGTVEFQGQVVEGLDPKSLRGLIDEAKAGMGSGIAAIVAVNEGRASVAVGMTDDLTADHNAVALVRAAVEALGGKGGGGRPDMAQGGGPDGDQAEEALAAIRAALAAA
ncbi:MAG: alanine--tRNA ligase-related protein, partial [Parasphingopyxis sp.]